MSTKFDLVLDIRSGSVGVCVFIREKKAAVPACLFSARVKIPLQKEFDGERGLVDICAGIKLALENVRKQGLGHPDAISVVIGTPWYLSQSRTVMYQGETPIKVDEKFVGKLLAAEVDAFAHEHYTGTAPGIVEEVVMKVALNGYPTGRPYNKMAKEVAVTFYLSMAQELFLEAVRKEIASAYHHREIKFHTFTFAAWQVARFTSMVGIPDLNFIDIGGEVSEWTLVEADCVVESVSFPIGAHTIIRDLAANFSIDLEEARTLYEAYQEKRVSPSVDKRIAEVLAGVEGKWVNYMRAIIGSLANTHILPTRYCVVGFPETARLFCEALGSPDIQALGVGAESNMCVLPTIEDLKPLYTESNLGKPDVFMAFEIIFLDKYIGMI